MLSLRIKLITPFIAGAMILTVVLSAYTYLSNYQSIKNSIMVISENKTSQIISTMNFIFLEMDTHIQSLITNSNVTDIFSDKATADTFHKTTEWLNKLVAGDNYFRDINILDAQGNCIASSNQGHIGASYIDQNYIKAALYGKFSIGESSIGRVTKKFNIMASGPINVETKIEGILVTINNIPVLIDYEKLSDFDNSTLSTTILTSEGLFEAHNDIKIMGNSKRLFPELYSHLVTVGEKGKPVNYSFQGQTYIGYAEVEPITKWIIITSGKGKEVFAPAYRAGLIVLSISLTIMLLISFIVIKFANTIISLLLNLIHYAKQISDGNLDIQLETTQRNDELGTLQESLQRLVQSLQAMLIETQQANTLKGQFLANMSHEIRTPLNAIIGMTHLTLREGDLSFRVNDFIKKIQLAAHSLLGLINDILDISKVEAGMIDLENISFNLHTLINDTIAIHQSNAESKNLHLLFEHDNNMPSHYYGDPLRIEQILGNLISNAIKFTKKGNITIKCFLDEIPNDFTLANNENNKVPQNSTCVYISVEDSGIGIPEHFIATLFKPFAQADASISRQFGGTGLGLAISSSLVELFHGKLQVISTLGKGSIFTFFMQLVPNINPVDDVNNEYSLNIDFENLYLKGKKILIAEDNLINQLIMEELLRPSGATIIIVENGKEAVDFLKNELVDIVFMDLQMPVMGGLEATKLIRELYDSSTLPIIAVTANAMKEDKDQGFSCGMNRYITKPIEPQRLIEVLIDFFK